MTDKKKILVIDDEEFIREVVSEGLAGGDYEVLKAYDGLSGLGMIEDESPDLIICDLLMPTVTGIELISEIKKSPQAKNIPLIVITASEYASPEKIKVDKEDILFKPFSLGLLRQKVEEKLNTV